jgi:phosphotransferase system  glucose/maltose/N-acetylglucosamine-specific IIC component
MTMNNIMICVWVLFIVSKIIMRIIEAYKRAEENIYRKPSPHTVYVVYLCSIIMTLIACVLLFFLPYRMFWIFLLLLLLANLKWELIYLFTKLDFPR